MLRLARILHYARLVPEHGTKREIAVGRRYGLPIGIYTAAVLRCCSGFLERFRGILTYSAKIQLFA